ncbi:MAG: glycosyltransferase family 39 protein, partial [Candidatus Rokubacteria bacterium]|nr:glycosyltransferase family 39 protein [Candidatus Rokubacteria bacterium]
MAGTFGLVVLAVAVWLAVDRRPPEWDHANHLERSVLCARDLVQRDLGSILQRSTFYPPLVLCAAGVAYLVAPSDAAAGQAVILAFLGLGMAATFLLGQRVAGGPGGVVAAVVFGTAPFMVWQALRFQLDVPLAAMVALALEVLLGTESFTRRGWSLAAGVILGLGMLTKPTFAVYVLPPALLVLGRTRAGAAWNATVAAVIATLVSLPWYGPRLLGFAHQISARSFRQAAEQGHPDPLSAAGLTYYPLHFVEQFGVVAVLLFAVGLLAAVRRRVWFPLMALLPLLVFFLIQNKNLRYTQPLLPAAAVLSGLGFVSLSRGLRWTASVAVVVAGVVQISTATFAVPPALPLVPGKIALTMESPPTRADWHHRDILAAVVR